MENFDLIKNKQIGHILNYKTKKKSSKIINIVVIKKWFNETKRFLPEGSILL